METRNVMSDTFSDYLNNQPIGRRTAREYDKQIRVLTRMHGESPSIELINSFVVGKARRRQPSVAYAVKHYLRYLGRANEIINLQKIRQLKSKKDKHFIPYRKRQRIIGLIRNEKYKNIALLQDILAARATEIISISKDRVSVEHDGAVKIRLKGKGNKTRSVFLSQNNAYLVLDRMEGLAPKAYLFLERGTELLPESVQDTRIVSTYRYYYSALRKAAEREGWDGVSTHDLRRSRANEIERKHGLRKTQLMLGHSSAQTTEMYLAKDEHTIRGVMLENQA